MPAKVRTDIDSTVVDVLEIKHIYENLLTVLQ